MDDKSTAAENSKKRPAKGFAPLRAIGQFLDACEPGIQVAIRACGWSAIVLVAAIFFFIFRDKCAELLGQRDRSHNASQVQFIIPSFSVEICQVFLGIRDRVDVTHLRLWPTYQVIDLVTGNTLGSKWRLSSEV